MMQSTNPANGKILWEGPSCGQEEIDRAIAKAAQALDSWRFTPLQERQEHVRLFGAHLTERKESLALTISQEMGKPLWESRTEVNAMIGKIETSIRAQEERCPEKSAESGGICMRTRHKPLGVCAVFGPYNFPGHLPNGHIVPALIAGNTVVLKPSELTPFVSEVIASIWQESGLPDGVLNLVQGGAKTGQLLACHPGIHALFFTGSWQTGKKLAEQFGSHPQRLLALEMGGNNPLVLGDIDDIDAAAYTIIQSAYLTSGQRCTSARRLILQEKHQPVLNRLMAWLPKIKVDVYDADPKPFMGPLISQTAAEKVLTAQARLLDQGAQSLIPCSRLHSDLPLLSPGLLDVTSLQNAPDDEVFGPLLQVIRVENFEASILAANHTAYGLSASLLSNSQEEYKKFYNNVRAGVINWNRPTNGASGTAPFGGVGQSGNYRPSAYYAADYCNYPVASLECSTLALPEPLSPGIPL